jgi:hypothetical protein
VTCWSDAILGGTVGSSDSVTFRNTFPTTSLCLVYIYDPCIFWATLATLKIHNSQREKELVLCSFGIHLPLAWGILSWWSRIARCIPWHSWVHWSSDGVWACYSWRLMAPRRSWWSECFWWALNDCGSLKKCLMYMVWDPPFRRWRMGTLSEHSGLCDLRGDILLVSAPTWTRDERQLLDTMERNQLSRVPKFQHLLSALKFFCSDFFTF